MTATEAVFEWGEYGFIKPGTGICIDDMPADEYHAVEALSYSGAKKILRSPRHFITERSEKRAPTPAMIFGTSVHALVLEGAEFYGRVVQAPECDKRTKIGRETWEDFTLLNSDKLVLTRDAFLRAEACAKAIREHPVARELLRDAAVERSLFWIDGEYKIPCRARIDLTPKGIVADVKTAEDASPEAFGKAAARFEYPLQGAIYMSGIEHALGETPSAFVDIVVESEPPHCVALYEMTPHAIAVASARMNEAYARYARALTSGTWPGYDERIMPIELPPWALRMPAAQY